MRTIFYASLLLRKRQALTLLEYARGRGQSGQEESYAVRQKARGRSERMFGTLQGRLPAELEQRGIGEMEEANICLGERFIDDLNERFSVEAEEDGSAFVPLLAAGREDVLCFKERGVVGNDNCVRYRGKSLQIPAVKDRHHFVRAKVMVHEYEDGKMAVVHGRKRKPGVYDRSGNLIEGAEEIRKAVGE